MATCHLYYWPVLQGRGEFVRLVLEEAGVDYVDVARKPAEQGGGFEAILRLRNGEVTGWPIYAPPALIDGDRAIAQTANICFYLGERHDLLGDDRHKTLQTMLTIMDVTDEAHDTHHPITTTLTYEEQTESAAAAAAAFTTDRMPALLGHLELVIAHSGGPMLFGDKHGIADLAMFQLIEGLAYAFPKATARVTSELPRIRELCQRVRELPRIAAYLASERRIPFNEHGIFRHYPELEP